MGTRVATLGDGVKVVLTKKLAQRMNGVDVSDHRVGDVLDLPASDARALVDEQWAILDRRHLIGGAPLNDRRRSETSDDDDLERPS